MRREVEFAKHGGQAAYEAAKAAKYKKHGGRANYRRQRNEKQLRVCRDACLPACRI
jgi:hypothetical protein